MTTPTPPSHGPEGLNRLPNGGGGNGGHGPPPPHSDDPGPPAILVEFLPTLLLDVTNAATMAAFVDKVQGAMAPLAAKLQAAGLRLTGPNAVAGTLRDDTPIVRAGLWILPPAFPFAPPDPAHPHQLPVLTAASQAKGFSDAPVIGVVEPRTLGGAFAFAIPVTTLNAFATAALPDLQSAAAKAGASLSSVSVTCVPPTPLGPSGGTVVTTFQGSAGFPSAGISGTITEVINLQPGPAPDILVPGVIGNLSSGTDVGNEVLLGAALVLGGPGILGVPFFIEALGLTLGVPPLLSAKIGPQLAMVTALVGMIPQVLPFEPAHPVPLLPDFPELTFNWTTFAVTTTSEIIGRATVTVTGRPLGSGSLTLTGPASYVGIQDDMDGGTSGDYTVTWADIAPTSFGWQAAGATGSSSGQIDPQVFPFQQGFSADFPLPQLVGPGRYHFGVQATATEVNVNNTSQTLTAAAHQGVTIDVLKNPPHPP